MILILFNLYIKHIIIFNIAIYIIIKNYNNIIYNLIIDNFKS